MEGYDRCGTVASIVFCELDPFKVKLNQFGTNVDKPIIVWKVSEPFQPELCSFNSHLGFNILELHVGPITSMGVSTMVFLPQCKDVRIQPIDNSELENGWIDG